MINLKRTLYFKIFFLLISYMSFNCCGYPGLFPDLCRGTLPDSVSRVTIDFPYDGTSTFQGCSSYLVVADGVTNPNYNDALNDTAHVHYSELVPVSFSNTQSWTGINFISLSGFTNGGLYSGSVSLILAPGNSNIYTEKWIDLGSFSAISGDGPFQSQSIISEIGVVITSEFGGTCVDGYASSFMGSTPPWSSNSNYASLSSFVSSSSSVPSDSIYPPSVLPAPANPDPVEVCVTIPASSQTVKTPGCWFNWFDDPTKPDCYAWCKPDPATNNCWTTVEIPASEACSMVTPPF